MSGGGEGEERLGMLPVAYPYAEPEVPKADPVDVDALVRKRRRTWCLVITFAVTVVLIIGLSVGITVNNASAKPEWIPP
jgi:hypothetical protein